MKRHQMTLKALRSIAKPYDVKIVSQRDDVGWGYWLEGTGWEDENFCADREEVYSALCEIKREREKTNA